MDKIGLVYSGVLLPVFLTVCALFFLFYLRGRPFRGLSGLLKQLRDRNADGQSARKTIMMALAGTLGVGNIVGVGGAIAEGGAGVLFWMWLSAFAAMILKYAEIVLSMRMRRYDRAGARGGPMFYLPFPAAALFCVLLSLCAFSVGSTMQTAACADAARFLPDYLVYTVPVVLACGCALCIFTSKKKLFDLSVRIVPFMTLLYSVLCLGVIAVHAGALPSVLQTILREAFTGKAAFCGSVAGVLTALRFGVVRGLVSNEAGCGTAPIAHASSNVKKSAAQGALGVVEVAVDTLLLCSLTGIALLASGVSLAGQTPIGALIAAFGGVFGKAAPILLLGALLFFAFATLVCWSFYLEQCALFLFKKPLAANVCKVLFCLFAAFGPFVPAKLVWTVSDFSVASMAFLNGAALFFHRAEIRAETLDALPRQERRERRKKQRGAPDAAAGTAPEPRANAACARKNKLP